MEEYNTGTRRVQSRQNQKPQRRKLKIAGLVLLFIAMFAVGYIYHWTTNLEDKMAFNSKTNDEIKAAVKVPKGNEPRNILLVGADKRGSTKSGRADTIVVARVDPDTPYVYMLSIPRDSYVSISGRGKSKINHSYSWGGPSLLIKTVENLTGLPIHYFSEVDFNGFQGIVDQLGGIDFQIDKGWHDRELNVDVRSGNHHRSGKEALAIVRSRHFPTGDFQRIKNQQRFLSAILKQSVGSITDASKITSIAGYSKTNMPVSDMLFISKSFLGASPNLQTATLTGKTGRLGGVSYVFVNETNKSKLLSLMKARKPFPM